MARKTPDTLAELRDIVRTTTPEAVDVVIPRYRPHSGNSVVRPTIAELGPDFAGSDIPQGMHIEIIDDQ